MNTSPSLAEIQNLISSANSIFILVPQKINMDNLASSLALFLGLNLANKKPVIACDLEMTVSFNHLIGVNKVSSKLPGKNFIISLDYADGTIEKVSYNIAGDKFNLVIEPKADAPAFSPEKVSYSNGSLSPDLIFVLGCQKLEDLGKFAVENADIFSKPVINLDYHKENGNFGKINIVNPAFFSLCEMMTLFLKDLGLTISPDMATNLLAGISFESENFLPQKSGAMTFEAVSLCLKAGGKREFASLPLSPAVENLSQTVTPPEDWLKPKILKSSNLNQTSAPSGEQTAL